MLDLKEPAGRAAFEKLLAASDVFVSNYRTEALTRLELAPEQVAARHPKLVVALITGYGRTGSEDDKMQAYEPSAFWARSGAADAHRYEDDDYPPMLSGGFGDHATALSAAGGICAALVKARESGVGTVVETSLFRTAIYLNAWPFGYALANGEAMEASAEVRNMRPYTARAKHWTNPLSGLYRCADAKLLYIKADGGRDWGRVTATLGLSALVEDERFATPAGRTTNAKPLCERRSLCSSVSMKRSTEIIVRDACGQTMKCSACS